MLLLIITMVVIIESYLKLSCESTDTLIQLKMMVLLIKIFLVFFFFNLPVKLCLCQIIHSLCPSRMGRICLMSRFSSSTLVNGKTTNSPAKFWMASVLTSTGTGSEGNVMKAPGESILYIL